MTDSSSTNSPTLIILAGPNGADKTTAAPFVLRDFLGIDEFVNADDIARGLSGFAPESVAIPAGRIMLKRLRDLAASRATFAFETTLATRSYARWLPDLQRAGYRIGLVFLYLASPDLAVERVRGRVAEGGHDVPEPIIRRRYARGLDNLFSLYLPMVDEWAVYNNSGTTPDLIAEGRTPKPAQIIDPVTWTRISESHSHD